MKNLMKRIAIFLLIGITYATVINIPADYSTIQAGINASVDSDTVLVQPGTYIENINFNGHNITLGSLFIMTGDTSYISQTVIDGSEGSESVVKFISGESSEAILSGFTITGGAVWGDGGGIYCRNSSPTLKNLIIEENIAGLSCYGDGNDTGGGIWFKNSNSMIIDTIIRNNSTCDEDECWHGNGGGLYSYNSNLYLERVLIARNWSGYGGGIYAVSSSLSLMNCTLSGNYVTGWNCESGEPNTNGRGIQSWSTNITISNSIFWSGQDIDTIASTINVSYSNIWGEWEGENNIYEDPLFVNPQTSDYHLQPNSPCIDAGNPESPLDPDGTIADMGTYYFDQTDPCPLIGDVSGDGILDVIDIVQTVDCILNNTDDCSCADLDANNIIDVIDIVLIVELILGEY